MEENLLFLQQVCSHKCWLAGGYVYRGSEVPDLYGKYVFGDYETGRIWVMTFDPNDYYNNTVELISNTDYAITSFGVDQNVFFFLSFRFSLTFLLLQNELFFLDLNGRIYKFTSSDELPSSNEEVTVTEDTDPDLPSQNDDGDGDDASEGSASILAPVFLALLSLFL
jgi:hypothetical protein